eukprot:TRINITY_DN5965_c0_g1_i1.p1 TRINITY_DN5965_c0_g1~~TRINITY_DN5965_c0_g1_i1.p1  ORF type:complete len:521 (-),score=120.12 TRINITY_DN5965_c0_g1_i1:94-1608(-)
MASKRLAPVVAILLSCLLANLTYAQYVYVGGVFERCPGSSGGFRGSATWEEVADSGPFSWSEIGAVGPEGAFVSVSRYDHYSKTLFIGGNFTAVGERPSIPTSAKTTANYASLDLPTTVWTQTNQTGSAIPEAMASSGDYVYISSYGGRYVGKDNAVVIEGLDDTFENLPNGTLTYRLAEAYTPQAIAIWKNQSIIIGGPKAMRTNGNTALQGLAIAQVFPNKGEWLPLGNGICNGTVNALLIINDILYVGGNFPAVNATDCASPDALVCNGLAAFNLVTRSWSLVGGQALPAGSSIHAISSHNDFNVTYYDSTAAPSAGGNSSSNSSSDAATLPRYSSDPNLSNKLPLLVVGAFSNFLGMSRMAKFDGTNWANLTSVPLNATGNVYAIAELNGNYFVGGDFSNSDAGISAVAKWVSGTSTWENLLGGVSCDAESAFCGGRSPVVLTLSTFPERSELVPPKAPSIFDFFEWKFWSIVLAGCVVLAMVLSIIVNVCFKCCARCKK